MNIEEALKESGVDYLIVMPSPPPTAKLNETFKHKLDVKSKKGGLKFVLESGPEGMKIDKQGLITWPIPKDISEDKHSVIVLVKDAIDQEVFHTFDLVVPELADAIALRKREESRLQRETLAAQQLAVKKKQEAERAEVLKQRQKIIEQNERRRNQSAEAKKQNLPKMRTWTDATGQHTFEGKFVRIENKKTVILTAANGKTIRIGLSKLSESDIYEAVKSDLQLSSKEKSVSPFVPFK